MEQVIGKMKNHETARITVKSRYGYGEEGNESLGIPRVADLFYEVRVNNFTKVIQQLYTIDRNSLGNYGEVLLILIIVTK